MARQQAQQGQGNNNFIGFGMSDFVSAGMLHDEDIRIDEIRFVEWDYSGTADSAVFALMRASVLNGPKGEVMRESEQHIRVGKLEDFVPSDDGTRCMAASKKNAYTGSNFHTFVTSLVKCGMPPAWLGDGDISKLDGLVLHVGTTSVKKVREDGDREVMVCTEIHAAPWDKGGSKSAGASKGAAKPASKPAAGKAQAASNNGSGGEGSEEALSLLTELLAESGGTLALGKVFIAGFKAYKEDERWAAAQGVLKNQAAIRALVAENSDTMSLDDAGVISLA